MGRFWCWWTLSAEAEAAVAGKVRQPVTFAVAARVVAAVLGPHGSTTLAMWLRPRLSPWAARLPVGRAEPRPTVRPGRLAIQATSERLQSYGLLVAAKAQLGKQRIRQAELAVEQWVSVLLAGLLPAAVCLPAALSLFRVQAVAVVAQSLTALASAQNLVVGLVEAQPGPVLWDKRAAALSGEAWGAGVVAV